LNGTFKRAFYPKIIARADLHTKLFTVNLGNFLEQLVLALSSTSKAVNKWMFGSRSGLDPDSIWPPDPDSGRPIVPQSRNK
jgi:hypothetical protein